MESSMVVCCGRVVTHLANDRRGATMLEYCLIAMLIAAVCVGGAASIGATLSNIFGNVATPLM